jgi:endoglucanase
LAINDKVVKTFTNVQGDANGGIFVLLDYHQNEILPASKISVQFVNDAAENGEDRNLRVDKIVVDGVTFQTESGDTYSIGSWNASTGCNGGYKYTEWLHCNGEFDYNYKPAPTPTPTPTLTPTTAPTPVSSLPTSTPTAQVVHPSSNPLASVKWFINPDSNAQHQADAWRQSRPADAAVMDMIARQPQADWFGGWSGDIFTAVNNRVSQAALTGSTPVLVAYNIPQRDCGGYSAGGVNSPQAYVTWIKAFAQGIGTRSAVVILEPDAVSGYDCLSSADRQTRLNLLSQAIGILKSQPATLVYLDAGHSQWVPATEMASRLSTAGIANANGFALNVSNFRLTTDEIAYGKAISSQIGGKHFVIDTSRNGAGPTSDDQWCNPPGRALGEKPSATTADASVDAYLWIKAAGESDGNCNGGPSAGTWWPEYALGLAQRSQ